MSSEDAETLIATIIDGLYCLNDINTFIRNHERFRRYCWYWYKCPEFKLNIKCQPICVVQCEDSVNDLWLATAILRELSIHLPKLKIRIKVKEQKANYLLIEAANYLDSWVDDFDEENSSVLLINGLFHIQINSEGLNSVPLKLNDKANMCILNRLNKVDVENYIEFDCHIPVKMAAIVNSKPWLLTILVHNHIDKFVTNTLNQRSYDDSQSRQIRYRIQMNKMLFLKIHSKCTDCLQIQRLLCAEYRALSSSSGDRLQSLGTKEELAKVNQLLYCSDEDISMFERHYVSPDNEIRTPDLSWMSTAEHADYKTLDLSTIDVAINDFFAERGCSSGAQLPWEVGHRCRPIEIDGDEILKKLESLIRISAEPVDTSDDNATDSENDDDDNSTNIAVEGLLQMKDVIQSTEGQYSPMKPLLSSLGINIDMSQN